MERKVCNPYTGGKNLFLKFTETKLKGSYIIELEKLEDERGFFARTWDKKQFERHYLNFQLVQCSVSFNRKQGTLRGLHYQIKPFEEAKLVRCTKGKIFDVIIDLRKNSQTYNKWFTLELSEKNFKMLYVPEGFAHGFQTLEDNTEVFYQMSQVYMPKYARGIRWNDPLYQISWPIKSPIISKQDNELGLKGKQQQGEV